MNEYAFIIFGDGYTKKGGGNVARITDPQKIEEVRRAAMEIIVEYGYRGMSIAAIAKRANVSVGYLYRYYRSKEDLIEDLMDTTLVEVKNDFLRIGMESKTINEVIFNVTAVLFQLAKEDPVHARLLATLVLDSDIQKIVSRDSKKIRDQTEERIVDLGRRTGEIGEHISEDEVLLILTTIPFRYVLLKLKEDNYESFFQDEHIVKISKICCNALK